MARKHNTDQQGNNWSEAQIKAVWNKGTIIADYPQEMWRRDKCSHAMKYSEHGNRQSDNGWEIDHINPVANGGGDEIGNLQPLYWKNNLDKGDSLHWTCPR